MLFLNIEQLVTNGNTDLRKLIDWNVGREDPSALLLVQHRSLDLTIDGLTEFIGHMRRVVPVSAIAVLPSSGMVWPLTVAVGESNVQKPLLLSMGT